MTSDDFAKLERRVTAIEQNHGDLFAETVRQTKVLLKLQESIGDPPNPFASSEEGRKGSGLMRIAYEVNDARRFTIKTLAVISTGAVAIIGLAKAFIALGIIHV